MTRAVSTVLGVLLLTAVTVAVAGAAGLVVLDAAGVDDEPTPALPVALEASVTVGPNETGIVLLHRSGPTLDVRRITVRISVDGTPLAHQPPVPFYSASGFGSFPSGPFNPSADPRWELGERASLEVTGENEARVRNGTTVDVELYRDDLPLARVETTVR